MYHLANLIADKRNNKQIMYQTIYQLTTNVSVKNNYLVLMYQL